MDDLIVIGAGPYGLSLAAHAAATGIPVRIFGRPMASWRENMPAGMFLKSEPWASHLSTPGGTHTLDHYGAERGFTPAHGQPLAISTFTDYGMWFAERAVPEIDERMVVRLHPGVDCYHLETEDGQRLRARTVALAVGVMPFIRIPAELAGLPAPYLSHSSAHRDLAPFRGQDVVVVGAGQAALETAALLAEHGARPRLVARAHSLTWNTLPEPLARPRARALRSPHSGLGTGWSSWIYSELPWAVRMLPTATRERIARTALGPAGAWWLRDRCLPAVPALLGHTLGPARLDGRRVRLPLTAPDGTPREVVADHVIAATGFSCDLGRLELLDPVLRGSLTTMGGGGAPALSARFESSSPGLFLAGLLTAPTFGPSMRFVYGADFTARRLVGGVRRRLGARPVPAAVPDRALSPS
ncbi:NAD(P)-binding domain-containing protein [Streptomyces sp. NPDC057638]|uniref:NAD(P)-binding domain-containing protein n=1 Tax=Streptomyces sp. NPDC057638 TaxID=3346190 RepID=UPI0036C7948F